MNTAWQRYAEAASGLTTVSRQVAERVVQNLVKQGEMAADRAERTVDELLKRSEENRRSAATMISEEVERAVARLGLVRHRDLQRLEDRIDRLQASVAAGPDSASDAAPSKLERPASHDATEAAAAAETGPPDKMVTPTERSRTPKGERAAQRQRSAGARKPAAGRTTRGATEKADGESAGERSPGQDEEPRP